MLHSVAQVAIQVGLLPGLFIVHFEQKIMLPHEYEIDQERCDQQDAIAEQLYIDGFTDGLDGIPPQSEEEPYKLGYVRGEAQRKESLCQANQLPDDNADWLEDEF